MRRFRLFAAIVLSVQLSALPGFAQGTGGTGSGFTTDQRREIVQILRDALKSDPTILRDAVTSLQADDQAREQADLKARIGTHQKDLTGTPGDPVAGNPAGNVTLVEFYDPRCPYCRRMLPAIQTMLHRDHDLRWVYKDIPVLGPASVLESRAILAAARQGAYLKMQDALMRDPAQPSDEMIRATARQLGLDPARLLADMDSPAVTQAIEANMALSRELHIDGTPVFVIGDQVIPGAVEPDELEAAITAARKRG